MLAGHAPAAIQTVRTAGVNWLSVVTITSAIVVIVSFIFGVATRYIANSIAGAIDKFRIEVIGKLDSRLTRVEAKIDNVSANNPRRGL